MRNLIVIFLLTLSLPVLSQELQCGKTNVTIMKTGEWESTRYQVMAQLKDRKTELWLNSVDYVNSQCILDSKYRNKILINAYCGGSGCSGDTYIIINAQTLMVELVPVMRRSNLAQAEEIIGKPITK
jgi:hypothetical protein